jgi:hypothetical protein
VVVLHMADPSGPDVAITPRTIAVAASLALREGWKPGEGTGVFRGIREAELRAAGVTVRDGDG